MSVNQLPPTLPGVDPDEPWPWLPRAKAWLEPNEAGEPDAVLYVACPFCGDVHTHGGEPLLRGEPHYGVRLSHCLIDRQDYLLVPAPEGAQRPKRLSFHERQRRLLEDDRKRGITYLGRVTRY